MIPVRRYRPPTIKSPQYNSLTNGTKANAIAIPIKIDESKIRLNETRKAMKIPRSFDVFSATSSLV
jgi:hypothetical protein